MTLSFACHVLVFRSSRRTSSTAFVTLKIRTRMSRACRCSHRWWCVCHKSGGGVDFTDHDTTFLLHLPYLYVCNENAGETGLKGKETVRSLLPSCYQSSTPILKTMKRYNHTAASSSRESAMAIKPTTFVAIGAYSDLTSGLVFDLPQAARKDSS